MKRTDLIALAERLEPMAAAPCFDGIDVAAFADFLRQIAQAQPVAWAWGYADIAAPCLSFNDPAELRDPEIGSVVALYTLPLED